MRKIYFLLFITLTGCASDDGIDRSLLIGEWERVSYSEDGEMFSDEVDCSGELRYSLYEPNGTKTDFFTSGSDGECFIEKITSKWRLDGNDIHLTDIYWDGELLSERSIAYHRIEQINNINLELLTIFYDNINSGDPALLKEYRQFYKRK